MKYKQWQVAAPCPEGQWELERAGLPPLLAGLLAARGVVRPEDARRLLNPGSEPIPDPLLMKDMDRAAARVRLALEREELIAVYGDYDVDGITATCLLTQFLTARGGNVIPYIPSRLGEGYGLNSEAVHALSEQGAWASTWSSPTTTPARTFSPPLPPWWTPTGPTAPTPSRGWPGWGWP